VAILRHLLQSKVTDVAAAQVWWVSALYFCCCCGCVQVSGKLIKAMLQLLKDNKDLLARKRLYIEFGCRGDWPEVSHASGCWQVNEHYARPPM